MPTLNKDAIFNGTDDKVLKNAFNNLKSDYTKENAIKYYFMYEEKPLSFILKNSDYIFTEPMKGYAFYKDIIENHDIPFDKLYEEFNKVKAYYDNNSDKMSVEQEKMYSDLLDILRNKVNGSKHSISISLYSNDNGKENMYDAKYNLDKKDDKEAFDKLMNILSKVDNNGADLADKIDIASSISEAQPKLLHAINTVYHDNPKTANEFHENANIENVLFRILNDSCMLEKVNNISNASLRYAIIDIGTKTYESVINSIIEEKVSDFNPAYSNGANMVNYVFEDAIYDEFLQEKNDKEKYSRLIREKAVLESVASFLTADYMYDIDNTNISITPSAVEYLACESTNISSIPQSIDGQLDIILERVDEIDKEILTIMERFTSDGSPSMAIAREVGDGHHHDYKPVPNEDKKPLTSLDDYYAKYNDTKTDSDKDDSDKDDDEDYKERQKKKKMRDDKYASMDIDDSIFNEASNPADANKPSDNPVSDFASRDDIVKPKKGNIFRRIQNKALDANVQFKKTVAKGRRTAQEARNAGNAVTKIPKNISDSVKAQVDEWDRLDDEKRKMYILEPGFRKKYFRGLKYAIEHYAAWQITPILNVVLLITHGLGKSKDIRIRNEVLSELRTEVKVCEAKIDDAGLRGDHNEKYKLMRIKDKLEAEIVRVTANSKTI